jgi:alanyl-tRNA synthetase
VEKLLATERALEKQVEQLKNKLAQAAAAGWKRRRAPSGRARCWRRASMAWTGSRCGRWPIRCATNGRARWWCWPRRKTGNVAIVAAVTKDLTAKVHAGNWRAVAQAVGGKGGGRPDMAEGGGKDAAALDGALEAVYREIESKL